MPKPHYVLIFIRTQRFPIIIDNPISNLKVFKRNTQNFFPILHYVKNYMLFNDLPSFHISYDSTFNWRTNQILQNRCKFIFRIQYQLSVQNMLDSLILHCPENTQNLFVLLLPHNHLNQCSHISISNIKKNLRLQQTSQSFQR